MHRRAALGRKLVAHEPVHAQQHHPGHGSAAPTINTLRAFVDSAASMDLGALRDSGAASPLEVVLGLKPAPGRLRPRRQATRPGTAAKVRLRITPATLPRRRQPPRTPRRPFAGMSEQMAPRRSRRPRPGGTCCSNNSARSPPPPPRPCRPPPSKVESEADKPAPKAAKTEAKPAAKAPGKPASKAAARAKPAARKAARLRRSRPPSAGPMISLQRATAPRAVAFSNTVDLYAQCSDSRRRTGQAHAVRPSQSAAHAGRQAHVGASWPVRANSRPHHGGGRPRRRPRQAGVWRPGRPALRVAAAAAGHRPRRAASCRCCSRATARTM